MNYTEVLQKYLLRIARGELLETSSVLPLVKVAKVFLPQIKHEDASGIVKITFPTFKSEQCKSNLIPVYLSKSNALSFAGTQSNLRSEILDPIELKGEVLFQVMPRDVGIVIEPSSSLEVIFPEEKLQAYIHPDDAPSPVQPSLHVLSGGRKQDSEVSSVNKENPIESSEPEFSLNQLESDLTKLLKDFPAVNEAYFLEHNSAHSEIILGLLAEKWSGDERFRVVESVAVLSKQTFGYAGAIEVYDDLHDTHSSSWDLFKMIPPFYTKEEEVEKEKTANSLTSQVDISSDKGGIRGSMNKITQSGLKLFSGLSHSKTN